jgi:LPS-assembly protein
MKMDKFLAWFLVALQALVFMPGVAAASKEKTTTPPAQKAQEQNAPITIEGDNLSYNDATGAVEAKGNVIVTQNGNTMLTNAAYGNVKSDEVWIHDQADFINPDMNLLGKKIHYNYVKHTGNMQSVQGKVGDERIFGDQLEFFPEKVIVHNGSMTRCPAKVPDYRMTADKIEIWPNKKMIAYHAKFWIKNTVIFSLPVYQTLIGTAKGQETSSFPRINYNTGSGVSIKQYIEEPVSDHVAAYADLAYYSKEGYRPVYGLVDRENRYSFGVILNGYYEDSNSNWIRKQPEYDFTLYQKRIGNSPLSYTVNASYGLWNDNTKSSWHQQDSIYFTRDTVHLGKGWALDTGTGFDHVHESYDGSSYNAIKYDATVTKTVSPKLTTWVGYHYEGNNTYLFAYNAPDIANELDVGMTYKIDKKDTLTVQPRYDLNNNQTHEVDYTWTRDLHCWQANITYRTKVHQWSWDISTTRW